GERVKVAFAKILLSRINVLILDEPTNFLDIHSIEALEDLLIEYPGTLIFVSHDRRFTEKIAERIFHITEEKLHVFEGDYQSFLHRKPTEPDAKEEQLLIIQTKLTEV